MRILLDVGGRQPDRLQQFRDALVDCRRLAGGIGLRRQPCSFKGSPTMSAPSIVD